jgi:hypothetical protein
VPHVKDLKEELDNWSLRELELIQTRFNYLILVIHSASELSLSLWVESVHSLALFTKTLLPGKINTPATR